MSSTGFLDRIVTHKLAEITAQQAAVPLAALQAQLGAAPPARPFAAALRRPDRLALIAEVKKQSPAKGLLAPNFDALALARTYAANGADAISVLTDTAFWGGQLAFLAAIRAALPDGPPLLRKDVILDAYQVYEARVHGADAVLLIVAALDDERLAALFELTVALGMDALVEVHSLAETTRALRLGPRLLGINNRSLDTFAVDIATTAQVIAALPADERPIVVSESGIGGDLARLRGWGADAILVGEAIVTAADPAAKVRALTGQAQ